MRMTVDPSAEASEYEESTKAEQVGMPRVYTLPTEVLREPKNYSQAPMQPQPPAPPTMPPEVHDPVHFHGKIISEPGHGMASM